MHDPVTDREAAIRTLFPLVKRIARRIHRMVPGSDRDDLIGDGSVGLIRAVDTFDPQRGPTLTRYAGGLIAGAILNGLRRLDPVSERVRNELRNAERERYAIAMETGAMPSQREMESRRPALARAAAHGYWHVPLSLDGPLPPGERMRIDWQSDTATEAVQREERERIRSAIHTLPPRQRAVLTMHYFAGRSLHQVGAALSISPQRASQLHTAGLRNLRRVVSGKN
jgi:RNA polymerase sigma factor for flagellar operon FliA